MARSYVVLLVVDVGNTQTHFGTYRNGTLVEHWRFTTVRDSTADELGAVLRNLLELRGIGLADLEASIVSSTVPQLRPEWEAMAARYLDHHMLAVGPGIKTGMALRYDNPREIGPDRLVNAVAAYERVKGACVVVDFGTAVTYDPVSAEGEYQASTKLGEAAAVISQNPIALQLRYLQTLLEISGTNNSTTILPIPIDILGALTAGKADPE